MVEALEAMSEDEVLAVADACAETARQAEVDLLRAAYQWAVLHSPERLAPREAALPGRERATRLGGPGVPEVTEFADGRISWSRFRGAGRGEGRSSRP